MFWYRLLAFSLQNFNIYYHPKTQKRVLQLSQIFQTNCAPKYD